MTDSERIEARSAVRADKVACALDEMLEREARTLHDRRIPGTRATIDHLVVSSAGVFVVAATRYAGRPYLRFAGGLLRPRTEVLMVGRSDATRLVTRVTHQLQLVRATVERLGPDAPPVHGLLCPADAAWRPVDGAFVVAGVEVVPPQLITDRLFAAELLTTSQIADAYALLAATFPSA